MASLTIGRPAADGARPAVQLAMKDIGGTSRLRVDDGFLAQEQRLEIGSVALGERAIGRIHYDTTVGRIHLATLADAVRAIADAGVGCASFADPTAQQSFGPLLASLRKAASGLLGHGPRFAVDRLSVTLPEGEARVGYEVVLGPVTEAELTDPRALVSRLGLKVEAVVSEALIGRFLNAVLEQGGAGPGLSAAQLDERIGADPLVRQGYLTRADGRISSALELRAGEVRINGRPLDDATAALAIRAATMAATR